MKYCPYSGDDCIYQNDFMPNCKNCDCFMRWVFRCTCNKCEDQNRCPAAFDPYNTDGDCLMAK